MKKKTVMEILFICLLAAFLLGVFLIYQSRKETAGNEQDKPHAQAEKRETVIGITLATEEFRYQKELGNLMTEYAAMEENGTLELCYAQWDANVQIEQIRQGFP